MFNEDRGANRGEWSELYTFCYILSAGKLHAADTELNRLEGIFFPVIKISEKKLKDRRLIIVQVKQSGFSMMILFFASCQEVNLMK